MTTDNKRISKKTSKAQQKTATVVPPALSSTEKKPWVKPTIEEVDSFTFTVTNIVSY